MARTPSAAGRSGRSTIVTIFKWLAYAALVGLLALIVAVAVATSYLPSYSELTKRSDLGQMIRVRAANGQVLVSMGPSFGQWLSYDQIPPEMRAAMISTEDRRFRSHLGVDPIGIGRALVSAVAKQASGQRDVDDHPAARPQHLPDQQPELRPQVQGSHPGARAGAQVQQGADPRALSEPRLFRRRRLRHRRGIAALLRPRRRSPEPRRGGDHRRPGQGAVQLFADRRRRGGARTARASSLQTMAKNGFISEADGAGRRSGANPDPADDQAEQRPLLHRLGAAAARHADRPDAGPDRRLDHARSRNAGSRRQGHLRKRAQGRAGCAASRSTATARSGPWSAAAITSTRSTIARPRRHANRGPRSSCR